MTSPDPLPAVERPKSLWSHRDFRRYWIGQAADVTGSSLSGVAIPLIAIVVLHATTWEAAVLATIQKIPPLLFALPSGALADRLPKRTIMITSDLVCAAAIGSLPLTATLGALTLGQLYVVAFTIGAMQVLGNATSLSYIPVLLSRDRLMEGNAKLASANTLADICGPALAAGLIGLVGAARAVALDALTFLISAICTARIRTPEPATAARAAGSTMRRDIWDGLAYTWRHPIISVLVTTNAVTSTVLAGTNAIWILYLVRELKWTPTALGLVMAVGSAGGFVASLVAQRLTRRFGAGPVMITALTLAPISQLPLLLSRPGLAGQIAISSGLAVQIFGAVLHGLTQRTVRQQVCDPAFQARMQASGQFIAFGLRPLATLLAGAAGTYLGLHTTLTIAALLLTLPALRLALNPIRTLRSAPEPAAT